MDSVEDCGINRMTFYHKYIYMCDLVEWSCFELAKK